MARIPLRGALMGMPGLLAMAMTAPLTHAQAPERGSEEYQATDLGDQITVYIVLSAVGLLVICVCVSSIFRRCCKSTAAKARRRYLSGDEVIKEQVARFREKHPREKEPAPPRIDRFPPMEVDPFPLYKNPRKAKIHNPHRIMRVTPEGEMLIGNVPGGRSVAAAQTRNPLARPQLRPSQRVYYEVIVHELQTEEEAEREQGKASTALMAAMGRFSDSMKGMVGRGAEKDVEMGLADPEEHEPAAGATIAVGWATAPYPCMQHVGVEDTSIGLQSSGLVITSEVSDGNGGVLGDETFLCRPFVAGDVIGCGYELVGGGGCLPDDRHDDYRERIVFFFTLNGERLAELPKELGTIDVERLKLGKVLRGDVDTESFNMLADGFAYPTVSGSGKYKLQVCFDSEDWQYKFLRGQAGAGAKSLVVDMRAYAEVLDAVRAKESKETPVTNKKGRMARAGEVRDQFGRAMRQIAANATAPTYTVDEEAWEKRKRHERRTSNVASERSAAATGRASLAGVLSEAYAAQRGYADSDWYENFVPKDKSEGRRARHSYGDPTDAAAEKRKKRRSRHLYGYGSSDSELEEIEAEMLQEKRNARRSRYSDVGVDGVRRSSQVAHDRLKSRGAYSTLATRGTPPKRGKSASSSTRRAQPRRRSGSRTSVSSARSSDGSGSGSDGSSEFSYGLPGSVAPAAKPKRPARRSGARKHERKEKRHRPKPRPRKSAGQAGY